MKIFELRREIELSVPLQEVFSFFADPGNLQAITPPWLRFQIRSEVPIEMKVGQEISYKLRVRGLPISWISLISAWDPPHRFVDEQIKGPYKLWIHEHTFDESEGRTLVKDHVRYAVPGGAWINRLFVAGDLRKIFDFRSAQMTKLLGG